jgi:hypothetical protein
MSHDDGFAPWYESWQGRMRADERMRWLVNARNRIEKQGDLEIHSVAKVRVLAGAWASPEREFEVPPQIGPVEIAMASELEDVPPRGQRIGIARSRA